MPANLIRYLLPLLIIGLAVGCDREHGPTSVDPDERVILKVMELHRSVSLGPLVHLFQMKSPHIELEMVEVPHSLQPIGRDYGKLDPFIQQHNPDILLTNLELYNIYAETGKLLPLSSFIHADQFDVHQLAFPVTKILQQQGGGQLYGLAPQFSSSALYYNKDLFNQRGIPYPTDRMSWEEVLQLARRFPAGNEVYGLDRYPNPPLYFLFTSMLRTHPIDPIQPLQKSVTVDTPSWRALLQQAVDAYQAGAVSPPSQPSSGSMNQAAYLLDYPFISGKAAMFISGSAFINELSLATRTPGVEAPDWDLVTAPVDPSAPNETNQYALHNVFAISAQSGNQQAAWELMKFIHGIEYARIIAITSPGILPARLDALANGEERNYEAFWTLSPTDTAPASIPLSLHNRFWSMARPEIEAAFDGKQSVADTLRSLQEKGEALLQEEIQAGAFDGQL